MKEQIEEAGKALEREIDDMGQNGPGYNPSAMRQSLHAYIKFVTLDLLMEWVERMEKATTDER